MKPFLGNFNWHLAIFIWSHCLYTNFVPQVSSSLLFLHINDAFNSHQRMIKAKYATVNPVTFFIDVQNRNPPVASFQGDAVTTTTQGDIFVLFFD